MDEEMIYSQPFSIELFKLLPPYIEFEGIIQADGTILYARPSHQERLISLAMERNRCSRDELMKMCPPEYHFDFMSWLCIQSGNCIAVWRNFFLGPSLSSAQRNALKKLKLAGIYFGKLSCPTPFCR